jgi:hypothetical protein
MVSREIWMDSCYFEVFEKLTSACYISKLHSKPCYHLYLKFSIYKLNVFYILLVSSISVASQFFKHFTKVEKITDRWIALYPTFVRPAPSVCKMFLFPYKLPCYYLYYTFTICICYALLLVTICRVAKLKLVQQNKILIKQANSNSSAKLTK